MSSLENPGAQQPVEGRRLWQHRDFLKLWAGQTVSEIGSGITRDGLPLAGVLTLGAGPAQMGLLAALGSMPVLVLGLFAGVWVDRLRRRPIMIVADLGRFVLLLAIPTAAFLGHLAMEHLYVVVVLAGILTVFFDVAYQSYLPSLVERENLLEGNSKLALSSSVAEMLGPGLAGVLVQALTAPIAILLDASSFLFSAGSLALIGKPEPPPLPASARQHVLREVQDGLQFVWRSPILQALAGSAAIRSFFGNFFSALYALYGLRVLGLTPVLLGITVGFGGVGGLLGASIAAWLGRRLGAGPVLILSQVAGFLAAMLIPLARGPVPVAFACLVGAQIFGDAAHTVYGINELSLRQSLAPERLLGRVNASMKLVGGGMAPLGALAGGLLAEVLGVRPTVWIAILGTLPGILLLVLSPLRQMGSRTMT